MNVSNSTRTKCNIFSFLKHLIANCSDIKLYELKQQYINFPFYTIWGKYWLHRFMFVGFVAVITYRPGWRQVFSTRFGTFYLQRVGKFYWTHSSLVRILVGLRRTHGTLLFLVQVFGKECFCIKNRAKR